MDAYIVIGEKHSYKSSTIRSLSGSRIYGVRPYVLQPNKVTQVFVYLSSLQEGDGLQPDEFVAEVSKTDASACLFSLRPNARGVFPDADAYLSYFIQQGWKVRKVAVLNSTTTPLHSVVLRAGCMQFFPLGRLPVPVNGIAASVRNHFGWL